MNSYSNYKLIRKPLEKTELNVLIIRFFVSMRSRADKGDEVKKWTLGRLHIPLHYKKCSSGVFIASNITCLFVFIENQLAEA